MRAWIVTREGSDHPTQVVAILSARMTPETIKKQLQLFHSLLYASAREQFDMAHFSRPTIPYKAEPLNPQQTAISCGHNPYLMAHLARKVALNDSGPIPLVCWQTPDIVTIDKATEALVVVAPGKMCRAPMNFVFREGA